MELKLEEMVTPMDRMFKETDRMFVGLDRKGGPMLITKSDYINGDILGICLSDESSQGNMYGPDKKDLFAFISHKLNAGFRIATFYGRIHAK